MMKIGAAFVFTAFMVSMVGCSAGVGADDGVGEGVPLQATTTLGKSEEVAAVPAGGETDKAICAGAYDDVRDDFIDETRSLGDGPFASFSGCGELCPANSFVYRVFTQAETNQGGGDDTALNGVWFACFDRNSGVFTKAITSKVGPWGMKPLAPSGAIDLPLFHGCAAESTANPFVGGQMRIEGNRGGDIDDTAANRLYVTCKDTSSFTATPAPTNFGNLTTFKQCLPGTAVCGIQTAVEGKQGGGDDTALNDMGVICCNF